MPSDPEAGRLAPGDLARLLAAIALVVAILVTAALFPLHTAVAWWAAPAGGIAVVAVVISVARHRR